jgi:hypothetical protein
MNWKQFTIACVSAALVAFPQNIVGCGPDADPYDYYLGFFNADAVEAKAYQPFYYTSYNFLYDETEPIATEDVLCKEWSVYCNNTVSVADAKNFLIRYDAKDLSNLYYHLEKNQPLKIPDSVKRNSLTDYFFKTKHLEALGYILYIKKTAPFVAGVADFWEAPVRDEVKMDKLIKNGFQLLTAAKDDFFKLRYTYQILRLAHYSKRYNDVIDWYGKYMTFEQNTSVIKNLCTALKAGALFRTGQKKEAAYLFSKLFASGQEKRVSNYLGFVWSVNRSEERNTYLQLCKANEDKANMLALFSMNGINNEIKTLQEIYSLYPRAPILPTLAIREINKLEEKYLTPLLQKQTGGSALFYSAYETASDSAFDASKNDAKLLQEFLHGVASSNLKNKGLFEIGAAYLAYMLKDFKTAKQLLASAEKMPLTQKEKDQWALTNLVVTISEKEKIDAAFEEQILPSLEWLYAKAKNTSRINNGWSQLNEWQKFYRNVMGEILATRYHEQGQFYKEALCIGAADFSVRQDGNFWNTFGIDFLRNRLVSKDVENLFTLFDSKQRNQFENFLLANNVIKRATVVDFAGTAYLRDYDFANAITWFKKINDKKTIVIKTNPFADLLYDREEALSSESTFTTTKLAFATEMLRLQKLVETDKANAAKYFYKMANGMYNCTYYGHAWQLVQYYRSGADGYYIPKNATPFQKEYYGCYNAHDYFEKAMNASNDKNFKARCLFMMAKCSQKMVRQPQYSDFSTNWDKYDAAGTSYFKQFKNNKYFPQLIKEYGNTSFVQNDVSFICSYLAEFIAQRKK